MAQSFTCINITALDRSIGGASSEPIPCSVGDTFIFIATLRYLSGGMQPRIYLNFMDAALVNPIGILPIAAVLTDTGWHIAVNVGQVPAGASWAVVQTDCAYIGMAGPSATVWEVSDYRITQFVSGTAIAIPAYAPLDTFVVSYFQQQEFVFPLYYLSLLSSEYRQSPRTNAWLASLIQPACDLITFAPTVYKAFDLDTAVGAQLDLLGLYVGASRTLPFVPTTAVVHTNLTSTAIGAGSHTVTVTNTIGMVVGNTVQINSGDFLNAEVVTITTIVPNVSFTAVFANNHGIGEPVFSNGTVLSIVLTDVDYRLLIRAKIAQNEWDGQVQAIYDLFNQLFPGQRMLFFDNQNMSALVVLAGTFSPIQFSMLINGLILPRPQGVLYTYTLAQLPLFGFDRNDSVIAGFDTGFFA